MIRTIIGYLGASSVLLATLCAGMPPGSGPQQPPAATGGVQARRSPTAALYLERCAACHGTTTEPGRAPSLFDDEWTHAADADGVARVIADGVPQTEMIPFGAMLTEAEIWQLVVYIKDQAGMLAPPPPFMADPDGHVISSAHQTFRMEVVVRDIETPWGLAFLPDGRLLVTERPGRLRIVDQGRLLPPVTGTPAVWERQDAGLFDVEVHPQYATNGWIYLSYAAPLPNDTPPAAVVAPPAAQSPGARASQTPTVPSMTAIVRGRINERHEWVDQQFIYEPPLDSYTTNNSHYGSRFIFDREGHLYYSIGDRGVMEWAQDLSSPAGKIHRVRDDGAVPADNPFVATSGALPTIWSYGHRNPQGLAWHPATGDLWESEHGPQGGDEINVVERGRNYGWGVVTSGLQPGIDKHAAPGMESPVVSYTPAIAPSGIALVTAKAYPAWTHHLFVSALRGQQLRRLALDGRTVTDQEAVFHQFGRVHDVIEGPDGYLYVTLQTPGRVLSDSTLGMVARLVPVVR